LRVAKYIPAFMLEHEFKTKTHTGTKHMRYRFFMITKLRNYVWIKREQKQLSLDAKQSVPCSLLLPVMPLLYFAIALTF
jgi:hypothetical protein